MKVQLFIFMLLTPLLFFSAQTAEAADLHLAVQFEDITVFQDPTESHAVVIQAITNEKISEANFESDFLKFFSIEENKAGSQVIKTNISSVKSLKAYSLALGENRFRRISQAWLRIRSQDYIITSDLPENEFLQFLTNFKEGSRQTASVKTAEGSVCSLCEFKETFRKSADDLFKNAEEFWKVSCKAESSEKVSPVDSVKNAMKACLSGFEMSMLDLVKFIKNIGFFFLDLATSSKYRSKVHNTIGAIILMATKDPKAFIGEIYSTVLTSLKESFQKLRNCSLDYQLSFTCRVITDLVTGGTGFFKSLSVAAKAVKEAKGGLTVLVHATDKAIAKKIPQSSTEIAQKAGSEIAVTSVVDSAGKARGKAIRLKGQTIGSREIASITNEVKVSKQVAELKARALKNPDLKRQMNKADEALSKIAELPKSEAERILKVVDQFSPEELQVFREEVKKPNWKWCR